MVKINPTANPIGSRRVGRIQALDSMRGIAVCLVFLYHARALWHEELNTDGQLGFLELVVSPLGMGWCGVDLFFVLSGTLITAILLETKSDRHYFRNFYARRTLRIFPLYYGVLIGIFLILPLLAKLPFGMFLSNFVGGESYESLWQAQAWFWTYTHNFYQAGGLHRAPGLGHFWTLAIEEQFYLVWPLIVFWLKPRHLMAVCLVGVLSAFLLRIVLLATGTTAWAVWHLTQTRFDTLLLGAMVAIAARQAGPIWQHCQSNGVGWALALIVLPIAIVSRGDAMHPVMQTCGYSALALLFAWWIARQFERSQSDFPPPWWNIYWLRAVGTWSYAIYLFHWPVLLVARSCYDKLNHGKSELTALGLMVLTCSCAAMITLLLAITSWYAYEQHWLKLKKYFEPSSATADQSH